MLTYINGEFVSEDEAKISVFDNGFMLGDGVYEIERTFGGEPFRLDDHMERLRRSLRYIELDGDVAYVTSYLQILHPDGHYGDRELPNHAASPGSPTAPISSACPARRAPAPPAGTSSSAHSSTRLTSPATSSI